MPPPLILCCPLTSLILWCLPLTSLILWMSLPILLFHCNHYTVWCFHWSHRIPRYILMVFHFIYHVHCTHLMNYSCFSCINLHPDFFFKFTLNYFPLFQFPLLPSTVLLPPLSSEVLPEFHSEFQSEFHTIPNSIPNFIPNFIPNSIPKSIPNSIQIARISQRH